MNEEIKVHVIDYGPDRNLVARYVCPLTGRQKSRSTKTRNRKKAEKFAAKWEAELTEGRYQSPLKVTWGEFVDRYSDEVLPGFADQTVATVRSVFNTVQRHVKPAKLGNLTAERLSHLQRKMRDEGRSEATIKRTLSHLLAALRWAKEQSLIHQVPKVKMPKRARSSNLMKGRAITVEEFERLLMKVSAVLFPTGRKKHTPHAPDADTKSRTVESWRFYLRGLWLSGLRLEESLNLWWDGTADDRIIVDMSGEFVMLHIPAESEKGNRDRLYPVAPEFAEFLEAVPKADRVGRVFDPLPVRPCQSARLSARSVCRTISAIGKAANVKVSEKAGKVKFASAHDLRRSFAERWSTRVMPQVLMHLMRHESIDTTMKFYVGRNAETTAKALYAAFGNKTGNSTPITTTDDETKIAESPATQQLSASTPYGI